MSRFRQSRIKGKRFYSDTLAKEAAREKALIGLPLIPLSFKFPECCATLVDRILYSRDPHPNFDVGSTQQNHDTIER
jgi:hypothetical protein